MGCERKRGQLSPINMRGLAGLALGPEQESWLWAVCISYPSFQGEAISAFRLHLKGGGEVTRCVRLLRPDYRISLSMGQADLC